MDYISLGVQIRHYRKIRSLTQDELAQCCKVSKSYIGQIERGEKHCSLEMLICLCNVLNVSPDILLQASLKQSMEWRKTELIGEAHSLFQNLNRMLKENEDLLDECGHFLLDGDDSCEPFADPQP